MFDPRIKILIVDDMSTMRKLIAKCVKDLGFTSFEEAGDGLLAWTALETANPPIGLIISDWNMPNCSGLDLLKKIRASDKYKNLPFLMVTAEAEQHQVVEAIKAGVSNYIVKPFTPQGLTEKLEAIHKKLSGSA